MSGRPIKRTLRDRPPRCWGPARREPAMLGIKNGRQPQLDNTGRAPRPPPARPTAARAPGAPSSEAGQECGSPLTRRVDLVPPRGAEPS